MQAKDIKYTIKDFYALPEGTCVELIEGVIYDMSPSPLRIHQKISMELSATIFNYIKKNIPCSVPMRRNMLLTLLEELLLLNRSDRFTCYRMFIGYKKQNENLCISLKSFTFVQLI